MSQDSDWWARRLSQPQQPQPQPRQNPNLPYRQQPQQQQPYNPQQFQQPQQQNDPRADPAYQQWLQQQQAAQEQVTAENFIQKAAQWRGGKGVKDSAHPCPECGGDLMFERAGSNLRGPAPAAHCFTCGYNGLFERQGDAANWGAVG